MGCCRSKADPDDEEEGTGSATMESRLSGRTLASGSTSVSENSLALSTGSTSGQLQGNNIQNDEDDDGAARATMSGTFISAFTTKRLSLSRGLSGIFRRKKKKAKAVVKVVEEKDEYEEFTEEDRSAWKRYHDPDSIFDAIAQEVNGVPIVRLLRLSYLTRGETSRGWVLPCREELPDRAFVAAEELRRVYQSSGLGGKDKVVPVISVSCLWETPDHPDPEGTQLSTLVKSLRRQNKEFKKANGNFKGFAEMGVFWDWGSLMQGDRQAFAEAKQAALAAGKTEEEAVTAAWDQSRSEEHQAVWEAAMKDTMDLWYAHQKITIVMLNGLMDAKLIQERDKKFVAHLKAMAEGASLPIVDAGKVPLPIGDGKGETPEHQSEGDGGTKSHSFHHSASSPQLESFGARPPRNALQSGWVLFEMRAARQVPKNKRTEALWPPVQELGRKIPLPSTKSPPDAASSRTSGDGADSGSSVAPRSASRSGKKARFLDSGVQGRAESRASTNSIASNGSSASAVAMASPPWRRNCGRLGSGWPVSVEEFDALVDSKECRFARESDREQVKALFHRVHDDGLRCVKELYFKDSPAPSDEDARSLAICLTRCPHLRRLNLDNSEFSGRAMEVLAEWLAGHEPGSEAKFPESYRDHGLLRLQVISIDNNRALSNKGARAFLTLAESGKLPNIKALNFSICDIGPSGAKALASACAFLPNLRELCLEGNRFEDAGAKHISKAGKHLPHLKALSLSSNEITDLGVKHIARAAIHGSFLHLERLELHCNVIADEGAQAIVAAVSKGTLTTVVDLEGNWITPALVRELDQAGVEAGMQRGEGAVGGEGGNEKEGGEDPKSPTRGARRANLQASNHGEEDEEDGSPKSPTRRARAANLRTSGSQGAASEPGADSAQSGSAQRSSGATGTGESDAGETAQPPKEESEASSASEA